VLKLEIVEECGFLKEERIKNIEKKLIRKRDCQNGAFFTIPQLSIAVNS